LVRIESKEHEYLLRFGLDAKRAGGISRNRK
jgi:hypothetical protein